MSSDNNQDHRDVERLVHTCTENGADAAIFWKIDDEKQIHLIVANGVERLGGSEKLFVLKRLQALGMAHKQGGQHVFYQENEAIQRFCVHSRLSGELGIDGVLELIWLRTPDSVIRGLELANRVLGNALLANTLLHASSQHRIPEEMNCEGIDQFLKGLYKTLNFSEFATAVTTESRVFLDVDRVTLAASTRSTAKLLSISGQLKIHKSSSVAVRLRSISQHVMNTGDPVLYEGTLDGIPQSISDSFASYIGESRIRVLWALPLTIESKSQKPGIADVDGSDQKVVGCLILEQFNDSQISETTRLRALAIADHVAIAFANVQRHRSIFMSPMLEYIGNLQQSLTSSQRRLFAIASLFLMGIVAALVLFPWEYKVTCKGRLMPIERMDVFAPWDAEVVEILVEGGAEVEFGQDLLRLKSDELSLESVSTSSAILEKKKMLSALEAQISRAEQSGIQADSIRLQGEEKRTELEIKGLEERYELIEKRLRSLLVHSPMKGSVVTFQPSQVLLSRPVQRGDRLLQVMNTKGKWRLELLIPEYKSGHVLRAFRESIENELKVEFVLSTNVEVTYPSSLVEVATRTEESERDGTVLECFARLDNQEDLPSLHIGAELIAKVHCGQSSLGYCLFGDAIEFVRRHLWF